MDFRSRGSSPNISNAHRGYSCGSCDMVAPTRPALRKHIVNCHPPVVSAEAGEKKSCPSSGCDFTTNSRCEMETHVASHVAQGMTSTGKKRTLALQRVRYRYLTLVLIFYSTNISLLTLIWPISFFKCKNQFFYLFSFLILYDINKDFSIFYIYLVSIDFYYILLKFLKI